MIQITTHAIQRFIERVHPCSYSEAREEIFSHARAIEAAASFGCAVVRCGGGERLILAGNRVVSVFPRNAIPRQIRASWHDECGAHDASA